MTGWIERRHQRLREWSIENMNYDLGPHPVPRKRAWLNEVARWFWCRDNGLCISFGNWLQRFSPKR